MKLVPTVFIVDDDLSVLKSLSRLLRSAKLNTVTFSSPQEFLDDYDPQTYGCLVLDLSMPEMDGLQLQQALVARKCEIPIIFLTGHGDISMSVRAMKYGAFDFLTKPINDMVFLKAIRDALEIARIQHDVRIERNDIQQRLATLTQREHEVLKHVITGKLNKQIAGELGITIATVKVHRARVMEKLKVKSLANLVHLMDFVAPPRTHTQLD